MTFDSFEDEVDNYYNEFYGKVHSSGTLGLANRIMHSKLELNRYQKFERVLELGCGNFEHQPFITHDYNSYIATDIRNPEQHDISKFLSSHPGNIFQLEDATNLTFKNNSFDRVLAVCLIVHLVDIQKAAREWQRVTKKNGIINFVIPCDPGLLLRVFRRAVSIPNAKKCGVSRVMYEKVNAFEHVSSFPRTLRILRSEIEEGRELKVRYFPFPFLKSWNFNAFAVVSIQGKKF
jgi:phosphatidylethanolamine/phosphatidyl-N-methylethanolamine N-methyltransferase